MDAVVGVFPSREGGERAIRLVELGFTKDQITMLTPHASEAEIHSVPTTEAEPPGIGRAIGAVTGGAAGAAAGIEAALLTSLVPGVGPVLVLGAIGALLLGIGGAAVGATLDRKLREGLPKDELYVYEDALRRGRTVVIALPEREEQAERARSLMAAVGAESTDAAREQWWLGLRDAEAAAYTASGGDFTRDEATYRRGFEAACRLARDGATYADVNIILRMRDPDVYEDEAFRQGFVRGRAHIRAREESRRAA
jgi:predicted lipid-binding transport protein (Tim44 family)